MVRGRTSAKVNHLQVKFVPPLPRKRLLQVLLHAVNVGMGRQAPPARETMHVRVDSQRLLAKRLAHHNAGRFVSHSECRRKVSQPREIR